jgi:hypothetical protein
MNKPLKIIVALPGLLLVLIGVRWLIDPAGAAKELGMPLLEGMGRSSQIGDVGSFFLCAGLIVLLGVYTQRRDWFYAASMMMAGVAVFRVVAWLAHDAPLAVTEIGVEVAITALLLFAVSRIEPGEAGAVSPE